MKKYWAAALVALFTLGAAALGTSQESNQAVCQQTVQTNCTRCHGVQKVCNKLQKGDANWQAIVSTMAVRGALSQEAQDAVLTCLTKSNDPKQLGCNK